MILHPVDKAGQFRPGFLRDAFVKAEAEAAHDFGASLNFKGFGPVPQMVFVHGRSSPFFFEYSTSDSEWQKKKPVPMDGPW